MTLKHTLPAVPSPHALRGVLSDPLPVLAPCSEGSLSPQGESPPWGHGHLLPMHFAPRGCVDAFIRALPGTFSWHVLGRVLGWPTWPTNTWLF